jgi:hypothetical protein
MRRLTGATTTIIGYLIYWSKEHIQNYHETEQNVLMKHKKPHELFLKILLYNKNLILNLIIIIFHPK